MMARELTRALNGRWHGSYGTARCPAHDDKTPSLSIRDGEAERVLFRCHAGCEQDAVFAAIRPLLGIRDAATPWSRPAAAKAEPPTKASPDNRSLALEIWEETVPAPGTWVDLYLRDRGLTFAIPPGIRCHPHLRHRSGAVAPAMVVRMDAPDGTFSGIARTWLRGDIDPNLVTKADLNPARMTLGPLGIAWFGPRDAAAIVLGEGVETVLAASELSGTPLPAWGYSREPDGGHHDLPDTPPEPHGLTPVACICADGLAKFDPPPTVKRIYIAEDDDDAGRRATVACADRAAKRGILVTVLREAR